ncbi:unnamed protein product [Caenorhabditis angaria]|uniref:C-type lectin domain-containing protein n=1 Tax=Caenorhabditis angaria TaxID=860376 RepID=A0A9P1IC71_9PELO|nr:unnamed protein product [Caenorhabditis angaria]
MVLNLQLILIAMFVFGFARTADIEGSGAQLDQPEETPHERPKFFNWDYKDLSTSAFEDISSIARQPIGILDSASCPDGWFRFSNSCYYVEQELLGFSKAEKRCFEKVRDHSPKAFFAWVGLVRFAQYEKVENLPRWQTEGAINSAKLNWLIKPYKPLPNGWTSLSNCVAHYHGPLSLESTSYTFYYPCTLLFHSICERNATLINNSNTFVL